ncbi:DUF1989 domain-containing protein [Amycolatopsis eburnea]|uniref:DUF1989 domain-containing protein n=1 Tax=Amycolatopsis eburnea TaxID=2267691 RepID=UPI0021F06963|nr:DUF1989 domain-containing protein [Amycolatopsis eburnea]
MATITADTLEYYGEDGDGGRVHDLLGTRCDPYVNRLLTGADFDVHDVLNVFQCTGLTGDDRYFMKACPGGDLSVPLWGPGARDPIGVEVFAPRPGLLEGWSPPARAAYRRLHGVRLPEWPDLPDRTGRSGEPPG